ncbi:MAG: response regulator transcription factor [Bacteroidales bacterium]|nr:response regulator transcription factor [Bacteroidales bacterium]
MRNISCIVIDDEPLALQLLESYVKKTPFLELRGSFPSATSAFEFIQNNPVDLLFCDIQMPGLSGMELSRMLPEGTRIIFTTAFSQYAVEGFKVHALDYLLKPVSYEDFLESAKHAYSVICPADYAGQPGTVMPEGRGIYPDRARSVGNDGGERPSGNGNYMRPDRPKSLFVKTEYRLRQVDLDKITFIEGFKDYVKIHLADGSDPILTLTRMKTLEEQLPSDRFVRVQKSYIVQMSKIEAIERSHIIIGKDRIPIGEAYQDSLLKAIGGGSIMPN